jgi:phospholipase/carboxylesterase
MKKQKLSLEHNCKFSENTTSEKSPVIVMLHGYGSDENDLFSFASELPDNYTIISLKAPFAMQPHGNAWYDIYWDENGKSINTEQAINSRELVVKCLDEIISSYNIDEQNITLLGFSQGTILSFSIALNYPEKIKNLIGLSGYIDESLLKDSYKNNDFSKLNIYSSHGSLDQVIPVDWARKTKPFLENLGIQSSYSEFPVGHSVTPQNFYELKDWLLKFN